MSICNCSEYLLLEIKQGTDRAYGFTIKHNGEPLNLTGASFLVEIKPSPYYSVPPLFTKEITETSERNVDGQIYDAVNGKLCLQINLSDYIKLPPKDYYLVVTMTQYGNKINVSGENGASGIFRIVKQ